MDGDRAAAAEDLERSARQCGALRRARKVGSAAAVVRLALRSAVGEHSLRATALRAGDLGIGPLCDVAVLKRLRGAADWLGSVLLGVLSAQGPASAARGSGARRIRLTDATTISAPGSRGTDWRVHVGFDLASQRLDSLELTDAHGGETWTRFAVQPGEVLLGDRGDAHRRGIAAVAGAGAQVLVRLPWQNLPLQHPEDGAPFALLPTLRRLAPGAAGEWPVQTAPVAKDHLPAIRGRLVARRKEPAAAQAARREAHHAARTRHTKLDPRTLQAASFVILFTTIPTEELPTDGVLALYRFRWQIELAFTRLKSVLHLDRLRAHDPKLARPYLSAHLLGAVLSMELGVRAVGRPENRLARPAPSGFAGAVAILVVVGCR